MTHSVKSPAKIAIKIGAVSFSAEGDPDWCEKQLGAVLAATSGAVPDRPAPVAIAPEPQDEITASLGLDPQSVRSPAAASETPSDFSLTLTNYLKARAANNRRLHRADGGMWRMPAQD